MKIIGLNFGEFNSSAAGCIKGKIIAGCAEERFIRQKKTKNFPYNSFKFCLKAMKVKFDELSLIAQAWNPGAKWINFNPLISGHRKNREDYFYSLPDHLYNLKNKRTSPDYVIQEIEGKFPKIFYIKHHLCHAANAFFLSNFKRAAFLTADWQGELQSITKGFAHENKIKVIDEQWMPNSIGMFYSTFTQLLGFRPDNDEWKVMAMSAENVDSKELEKKILSTISLLDNGKFELDQSYYTGSLKDQPLLYSKKLVELLSSSSKIKKDKENYIWKCQVAKAMQIVSEKIIWHILNDLYSKTKLPNLVLSGGFFMNCVLNGKVLKNTRFKKIYISHSPDDVGNAIGAALYAYHCILKNNRVINNSKSNIGPSFSNKNIIETLEKRKIQFSIINDPHKKIASFLSKGKIVAINQGKMEFGDRALGFRSILADPRKSDIKDIVNSIIKYREEFRPFAPSILSSKVNKVFDVRKEYECGYMEKVVWVKPEWKEKIPGVIHFDGSARAQTVKKIDNPYFYKIIEEFENLTDIPLVLNTSFNINGEPIVLTPDDALNTFFNSGLEILLLNNVLIQK